MGGDTQPEGVGAGGSGVGACKEFFLLSEVLLYTFMQMVTRIINLQLSYLQKEVNCMHSQSVSLDLF